MKKSSFYLISLLLALSLIAPAPPVFAQSDFAVKTINIIVPFKEKGGADIWARLMAPILSRHLPGNPQVNVVNVPGGGSTKAANDFAAKAKPDGLSLLITSGSTQFPFLLGDKRVRYDYEQWRVLMAYRNGGVVYTTPVFGIDDASQLDKLHGKRLVYGSQGTTSLDLVPLLGFKLLGLNVKTVFGVRGRGAGRLAFERGEANIDFQTSAAYINYVKPLVAEGRATPLFSLGVLNDEGELIRDPEFPDLPHFAEAYEIMHDKAPEGLAWESWFAFFSAGFGAQKLLVVPKETPARIVNLYQDAIRSMLRDAQYLSAKEREIGSYEQVTGEAAERLYKMATGVQDKHKNWVRNWLRTEYKLSL